MKIIKQILLISLISWTSTQSLFAQNEWLGQLTLNSLDCDTHQACYTLGIKGIGMEAWALGDQNYRLFFDADNASITSIESLLPANDYSNAQTDEILEIVGQGQEAFSPLDQIDDNLGFLDFNIIAYVKQSPEQAVQVSNGQFTPIAEICLEVSEQMLIEGDESNAMNIFFSRSQTAGQITSQFSVISAIDSPNHTKSTHPVGFLDISYVIGLDAQLGKVCKLTATEEADLNALRKDRLILFPNPYTMSEVLSYQSEAISQTIHEVTIYDANSKTIATYKELPIGNHQITLPLTLSAGVYFFHIKNESLQFMEELILIEK